MELIEAPAFTRVLSTYLDEDGYRALQQALADRPELGDVIEGTGGFRKLRWPDPRRGKGRRGGLRLIYYFFESAQQIWLMTLYDKDERDDLSPAQKKVLKAALENELAARRHRRSRRK
jgi:hypothetical protein